MPGKTLYCLGEAWLELNSPAPLASAEMFSPRMGGSAASLALAYAAQGGRASLLTQLGEDAFGHRIADALSTAGVDISRVCFTSRAPTPLLFDGGGEKLACRTRSSELLYAPEQLGADWAAEAEMLAFSSACLVDSPCRYTHLAALDTANLKLQNIRGSRCMCRVDPVDADLEKHAHCHCGQRFRKRERGVACRAFYR